MSNKNIPPRLKNLNKHLKPSNICDNESTNKKLVLNSLNETSFINIKGKLLKNDDLSKLKNSIKEFVGNKGEFIHGFYISAKSTNLNTTK